jgi:hypothetical protein
LKRRKKATRTLSSSSKQQQQVDLQDLEVLLLILSRV